MQIYEFVVAVVRAKMNKTEAIGWIARGAEEKIPIREQARFIEAVETELRSLHEGNIARYRLKPSEFDLWSEGWK